MDNWIICVPSYKRSNILTQQTLNTLQDIDPSLIKIFVVEEEKEDYIQAVNGKYEVIVGVKGIAEQREFIERYFPEGTQLVFMDDDIKSVDFNLAFPNQNMTLSQFITLAFDEIKTRGAYIWGVYPVYNAFFRQQRQHITDCLSMCIGAFYGIINRPNDPDLRLTVALSFNSNKEDVERSILYFKKDGKVVRFNKVGFQTKYYGSIGGMGTLKERMPDIIVSTQKMYEAYSEYGTIRIRKSGIHEFKLLKLQSFDQADKLVTSLPIPPLEHCNAIYEALSSITISNLSKNSQRAGFGKHRSTVFGITRHKFSGKIGLSRYSLKHPKVYEQLVEFGKVVCGSDFTFTSIQVNHNVTAPRHKDKGNVGKSIIISVGDYTGSQLGTCIDGIDTLYNTHNAPFMFSGSVVEHYNTPDLLGNKYSLIFYNHSCSGMV